MVGVWLVLVHKGWFSRLVIIGCCMKLMRDCSLHSGRVLCRKWFWKWWYLRVARASQLHIMCAGVSSSMLQSLHMGEGLFTGSRRWLCMPV